ncbi:hypothetical protein [Granulicella aggregans]|uniref:hypothetical protein n=1 Tax=Granulicella aggregans TaxID=474949 RepID=UPI001C84E154|nr:hypothetical protein [Granulicella aggregans]
MLLFLLLLLFVLAVILSEAKDPPSAHTTATVRTFQPANESPQVTHITRVRHIWRRHRQMWERCHTL